MTAASFPEALRFTLREEGGNDDDPQDHGGRTSRGIIQREWDAWRAAHADRNLPADVWEAPQDQIEAIYQEQYWQPYCDKFPGGLDLAFFDFAVNAGRQQAVRSLQRALGVTPDGMMGVVTSGAVAAADIGALVRVYTDYRSAFYHSLAQFSRYGKDWIGRTNRCEAAAERLVVAPATAPAPGPSTVASPKANPDDLRKPPIEPAHGVVVSGVGSAAAGALQQLHDQLSPYAGTVQHLEYALIGIAALSFVLTLYGFWHRARTSELAG